MRRTIPRILIPAALLLSLSGCGYAGPEKAVRQELDLIKKLDESTIKAFVSYEDIQLSGDQTQEIGAETTEAVKLFFKDFEYHIRSSSLSEDENSAVVTVDITNLDAKALAKDLCRIMITESSDHDDSNGSQGLASAFSLMKDCLENNTYETRTTSATVNLSRKGDTWLIQESAELEDQLAGGLATYLSDPYLLTPQEVLDITLEPFHDFTGEQWITYLNIQDVFSVGTDLAPQIDQALASQISSFFDYKIESVTQDGDEATANVQITSLDLESVINQCRSQLLEYAQTTESIRASDEELALKTAEILLEALNNNTASVTNTVPFQLINNGYTWEEAPDESFADALLGGVTDAVSLLYATE